MRGDFDDNDDDDDDLLSTNIHEWNTNVFFLPRNTLKTQKFVRAGGSLIEDVAGNVVAQRFRRLQLNATWK